MNPVVKKTAGFFFFVQSTFCFQPNQHVATNCFEILIQLICVITAANIEKILTFSNDCFNFKAAFIFLEEST